MDDWELVSLSGGPALKVGPGRPRVLGRSPTCDFPVFDVGISREHLEVTHERDGLRLRDLGSTNGVLVNGVRVREHLAVAGDKITCGAASFELRRVQSAPGSVAAADEPAIRAKLPVEGAVSDGQSGEDSQIRLLGLIQGATADSTARKAAALLAAGAELAGAVDLETLLDKVVRLGFEVLEADRASLMTVKGDDLEMTPRAKRQRSAAAEASPIPRSLLYEAVAEGVAILSVDLGEDERFPRQSARRLAGHSALCVPLVGEQRRVLGLLYLERTGGRLPFLEEDLRFVVVFAGIAGLALQNQALREEAQRDAVALARLRRRVSPNFDPELALEQAPAAENAEYRDLVVMVADLRGLSAMAARHEAASAGALLGAFYARIASGVLQYGGTLNNLRGPSLLALWGTPLVTPHDADRALRAAQAIFGALADWNRKHGLAARLDVGLGLGFGKALLGSLAVPGGGGRQELTVAGAPLDDAVRLAAAAGPGEALLNEEFVRALSQSSGLEPVRGDEARDLGELAAWRWTP